MTTKPTLAERPELRKLKIQCWPGDEIARSALEGAIRTNLPGSPSESTGTAPSVFWTAPCEWLVVSPDLDIALMTRELDDLLAGTLHALTDLSAGLAVLEVRGHGAADLLSEGCSVDFARLGVGHYALTRLEQIPVIIHLPAPDPAYHVYVDRTASSYLREWLKDGAAYAGF